VNSNNRVTFEINHERNWIACDLSDADPEKRKLGVFSQKLESALNDLGRIDYQLHNALVQLNSCQAIDSYDALNIRIVQTVSPGIQRALAALVDEIRSAKGIADELGAGGCD
jgi:hypothetical protein